jgi:hypothetical protein
VLATNSKIGVLSSERLDVTTASEERLQQLGYPKRPDPRRFPQAYKLWLYAVTTPGAYVPARPVTMVGERHGPTRVQVIPKGTPADVLHLRDLYSLRAAPQPRQEANLPTRAFALSPNWSGFVLTNAGDPFLDVHGTWNVPAVTIPDLTPSPLPTSDEFLANYTSSSEWVGIDGYGTNDVIQDGTRQDAWSFFMNISNFDNLYNFDSWQFGFYYAWYEYFPQPEQAITGMDVVPGDQITSMAYVDTDSNGTPQGNFIVANNSNGQATVQSLSAPNYSGTTVEWVIRRRPEKARVVLPAGVLTGFQSG